MTVSVVPYVIRRRYDFSFVRQQLRRTNHSQTGSFSSCQNQHPGMDATNQVSHSPSTGAEVSGRDLKCVPEPLAKFYQAGRDCRFFVSVEYSLAV
jgi:hypothetical protein